MDETYDQNQLKNSWKPLKTTRFPVTFFKWTFATPASETIDRLGPKRSRSLSLTTAFLPFETIEVRVPTWQICLLFYGKPLTTLNALSTCIANILVSDREQCRRFCIGKRFKNTSNTISKPFKNLISHHLLSNHLLSTLIDPNASLFSMEHPFNISLPLPRWKLKDFSPTGQFLGRFL
jgi:hypothetical protein